MKKSRFTEEQIGYALRQAETGTKVSEVYQKIGVAEATFYNWRKKYDGLEVGELRRLTNGRMITESCWTSRGPGNPRIMRT